LFRNTPEAPLRESAVRKLSAVVFWSEQRGRWRELCAATVQKRPALRTKAMPANQP